jgi:hypothetical protein
MGNELRWYHFPGLLAISALHICTPVWKCNVLVPFSGIILPSNITRFFYIRPHRYIQLQIAQGILTAKLLKIKEGIYETSDRS